MPPALFLIDKMIQAILGTKLDSTRKFTKDGKRIPVTSVKAGPCYVVQIRTKDKDGYSAVQLGWGEKKLDKANKPIQGQIKKAGLKTAFLRLSEIRLDEKEAGKIQVGDQIKVASVFKPGDVVKVTGWSKGKGFTGVVKRWGFKGGPRTHGQSNRERSPGSIGQGTTPGRVHKGKKMPGRAGGAKVTVSGLTVVSIDETNHLLLIKGLVPGSRNGFLIIRKQNA